MIAHRTNESNVICVVTRENVVFFHVIATFTLNTSVQYPSYFAH